MSRLAAILLLSIPLQARSQSLPLVEDVEWSAFQQHLSQLLPHLEKMHHPKAMLAKIHRLIKEKNIDEIQKVLAPLCLIGLHINPESRVKAKPGSASVQLILNKPTYFLVQAHNEGDVKAPVKITGENGQWLQMRITHPSKSSALTGHRLEYLILKLTAKESGKREVTFKLDAGQGTQDLGFRAEVPILFHILKRK